MCEHYTADAQLLLPKVAVTKGQEAVTAFCQAMKMGLTISMDVQECDELCNDCIIQGTYLFNDHFGFGDQVDCGRYIACLRIVQGRPKIYSCCFNSSTQVQVTPEQCIDKANQTIQAAVARGDTAALI